MYNLGNQFKFNMNLAKSNPEATIVGEKYRFTILTESMIRLEYSENGVFNDNPTSLVWYRNFNRPEFYVRGDKNSLEIKTNYFTLTYLKNAKFGANPINPSANLKIFIPFLNKTWYYKHPEARKYDSYYGEFDKNSNLNKIKGFYSLDGFTSIDDSKSLIFNEDGTLENNENQRIDVYFFAYGNNFNCFLNDYYKITGYPSLIPRYAFGIWWYKNENYNDYTFSNLIKEFENKDVPLSVIILNDSWHKYKTGFTFNINHFKEPNKMINYLHSKNIKLGLTVNLNDIIQKDEEQYKTVLNYIKPNKKGNILLNIKNNIDLDVYFKIFIHSLTNLDVDFFNIEDFDEEIRFLINHYHSLDTKVINNRRNLILSKDSLIASHRYPIFLTGHPKVEWDTLKKMCEYNINLASRGIHYVAHAYGGYMGGIEESELYIRFIQLATFSSIFMLSSNEGKYYKREPFKWDNHTFSIVREFMQFRSKLIPYLYNEGFKSTAYGVPLIEPVFYRYPNLYDDIIYHSEYFLGSELYISPILTKKEEMLNRVIHRFFLPQGIWYDFYSGKRFLGNKKYVLFYNDESYPVFAKSGAIIPLGHNENINDVNNPTNLEIIFFPGANNVYTLYEDDGITEEYKENLSFQTDIEYKYFPNNIEVLISPKEGNMIKNHNTRNFKLVLKNIRDNANVEALVNLKEYPFRKYANNNDLIIELNNVNTLSNINLKCFGKDIEVSNYRVLNEDVSNIISDLLVDTELKNELDKIVFSSQELRKKRIEIRKLKSKGLENRFINLFLKLLDYIADI